MTTVDSVNVGLHCLVRGRRYWNYWRLRPRALKRRQMTVPIFTELQVFVAISTREALLDSLRSTYKVINRCSSYLRGRSSIDVVPNPYISLQDGELSFIIHTP